MKKIKLVLSGSGTRFPVFAGAIQRLVEEGYEIEAISGTSGGAIVSIGVGLGFEPAKMIELCMSVLPGLQKLIDPSLWSLMWKRGLIKGDKIEKELLTHTKGMKFSQTKTPLKVVTVNYDKATKGNNYFVFGTHETPDICIAKAVRASMSIPFIFKPVIINGDRHIDGGVAANLPLDIFGNNLDNVIGLNVFAYQDGEKKKAKNMVGHMVNIIDKFSPKTMKKFIESSKHAKVINLETKHAGLNFFITEDDVIDMVKEGYMGVDSWLRNLQDFMVPPLF